MNCNVCGSSYGSGNAWTVNTQPEGCDQLPFTGNLAHAFCATGWRAEQSRQNLTPKASAGYVSGTVINDVGGSRPFRCENK
mgnify:CR=1 FL=1